MFFYRLLKSSAPVCGTIKGYLSALLITKQVLSLSIRLRESYQSMFLWVFGSAMLVSGLTEVSQAQTVTVFYERVPQASFMNATCTILGFVQGSFGGLMVTISGIIAIVSAAFGAFKASTAMVATGTVAFVLRDLIDLYFDMPSCNFEFVDGGSDGDGGGTTVVAPGPTPLGTPGFVPPTN